MQMICQVVLGCFIPVGMSAGTVQESRYGCGASVGNCDKRKEGALQE